MDYFSVLKHGKFIIIHFIILSQLAFWLINLKSWTTGDWESSCCIRSTINQLWRYWSLRKKGLVKLMPCELKTGLLHDNCLRIFHWKGICFWLQHKSFPYVMKFNRVNIHFLRRLWPPLLWCCEWKLKTIFLGWNCSCCHCRF